MKTIIAGSRTITDMPRLLRAIESCGWAITEVVSGGARGADTLGEDWARANNIPVKKYIPDWKKHGKAAGIIRNTEMARNAEALIALWDGQSAGTRHMVSEARKKGLAVFVG